MSTELTLGELANLEPRLLDLGRRVVAADVASAIHAATEWFATLLPTLRDRLGTEVFATLVAASRGHSDPYAKHLCMGALVLVHRDASAHPEQARFVARFAAQRLRSLSGSVPLCSPAEEAEAQALFEAAKGDRSYPDEKLSTLVSSFVQEHHGAPGFYGRLAASLEFLLGVLANESAKQENRETARAALTYFVVTADAIPDDLGLVGLLDDAMIVQRAVAEIYPERREVTKLLEDIIAYWPFVEAIALTSAAGRYPMSEFVLVNTALLLGEVLAEGVTGAAIVVPTFGPLPLLCGFIRAIAEIRGMVADTESPTYEPGDRLRNRTNDADVEFVCYCRLGADGSIRPCDPTDATHFRYRSGEREYRMLRLDEIAVFHQSPRTSGRLRRGNIGFDQRSMAMGPLERLFGRTRPIILPSERRRVVVVMDPLEARRLAGALSLFGASLHDVVPMSGARIGRDGRSEEVWTKTGPGGAPMLTVVRTVAEALDLIDDDDISVGCVVARVRPGTTDAANVAAVHERAVPIVAIVATSDSETHGALAASDLRFWKWDKRWFGALHWPAPMDGHDVGGYEGWLQGVGRAEVRVQAIPMPEFDQAWTGLTRLSARIVNDDNDLLSIFFREAVSLLQTLRTRVTQVDDALKHTLSQRRKRLASAIRSGLSWWPDEEADAARSVVAALDAAIDRLSNCNPKWEALRSWAENHPNGTVICSRTVKASLDAALPGQHLAWSSGSSALRFTSALVPAWSCADKMDRLLHPPVASELTLLLYGPEVEWYEASIRRRERVAHQLDRIVSNRPPFRAMPPRPRDEPVIVSSYPEIAPSNLEPDEMVVSALRSQLLRQFGNDVTDPVIARLVRFAGGSWTLFSAERRVHTITHLLGDTSVARHEFHETPAWDLRPGDVVVLVRGSDRDVIRVAVDEIVPPGARETAAEWQRALRRYAIGRPIEDIARALGAAGCNRRPSTVMRWIKDDTMIRPRLGRPDIEAITRVTHDQALGEHLDECVEASDELFRQHAIVGRQLATRVLEKVKDWISAGDPPDEIVDIDHRIAVVTVETVDPMTMTVPRSLLGRLEDSE